MDPNPIFQSFSGDDLGTLMAESQKHLVILIFTADWLGIGHILESFLHDFLSENAPAVKVYRIDIDKNESFSNQLSIRQFPSTLLLKNGEIIDSFSGLISKRKIREKLERYI